MIIDCHNHVLGTAMPEGHDRFVREMRVPMLRAAGRLPEDRAPSEQEWAGLGRTIDPIDPGALIEDHKRAGVDRSVVLAVAPSDYTRYGRRGTTDLAGVTSVPGPVSNDKANDYIAALCHQHPELIGMAAVNPRYRGVEAARTELARSVQELGLTGLKLYPMYDQYRANDRDLGLPVFEEAQRLGIPVMVHMGTTPAKDAVLEYGNPAVLDDVARTFPDLRLLICHAGYPWSDECFAVAGRHDNVYADVSYTLTFLTQRDIYELLLQARKLGCGWSKLCWGTDYPGGGDPGHLLAKFALIDDVADRTAPVSVEWMARMVGGNWARFAGIDGWSESQTVAQLQEGNQRLRELLRAA